MIVPMIILNLVLADDMLSVTCPEDWLLKVSLALLGIRDDWTESFLRPLFRGWGQCDIHMAKPRGSCSITEESWSFL